MPPGGLQVGNREMGQECKQHMTRKNGERSELSQSAGEGAWEGRAHLWPRHLGQPLWKRCWFWPQNSGKISRPCLIWPWLNQPTSFSMAPPRHAASLIRLLLACSSGQPDSAHLWSLPAVPSLLPLLSLNPISNSRSRLALPAGRLPWLPHSFDPSSLNVCAMCNLYCSLEKSLMLDQHRCG